MSYNMSDIWYVDSVTCLSYNSIVTPYVFYLFSGKHWVLVCETIHVRYIEIVNTYQRNTSAYHIGKTLFGHVSVQLTLAAAN